MLTPFAIENRIQFTTGRGGWTECELSAPGGKALMTLYGAQLLSYIPSEADEALWLSPNARFEPGRAIRGGIPICWPWFGPHPDDPALPQHGFARNRLWQIRHSFADDGITRLTLGLSDDDETRALWPHAFDLELEVELGDSLSLRLTSRNTGRKPFKLSEALHSYFSVVDVREVQIQGLDGCRYQDKLAQMRSETQQGTLQINQATDRVYDHPDADCLLIDPASPRQLRVSKSGSGSTIIWNPAEGAADIADIGTPNQQGFVCIESGNALHKQIELQPDQSHTLNCRLAVQAVKS